MTAGSTNPSLRHALAAKPPAARSATLLRALCERSAAFLGRATDDVTPESSWVDLGFDSLRAVDFRSDLEKALDLRLRSTLLFDQPTPTALAKHLLGQLAFADSEATKRDKPVERQTTDNACDANGFAKSDAIAIVGAACRFPGSNNLDEFWQLLRGGGDAVRRIGNDRFDIDAYYDPDPAANGKIYVREAGLLDDLAGFDAALFGISPREATMLDPQQRLLLETSWHALEHAGHPPATLSEQTVGVYVGTRASEYFDSQSNRSLEDATSYYPTGNAISTAAGRISFTFGFKGPCYALDTACSGSLVAVHNAVRALKSGECDVALAGGVNAIIDPVPMAGLCRARMLAPDGRCKSFDARADGYGRGEGCGMIVLKRLRDAQLAGDRILAVVRGTASNQDGRSSGLTVPHGPSQAAVIRAALADAGLQAQDIDYVEAHGTGTALGDPIEIAALDDVFAGREQPLQVGTVKTNIGHLEAAAGISGLIKTLLALQHRELPKTLHCTNLTPHIDWHNSVVSIVRNNAELSTDKATHFAGISSFGFSGTNCHVILSSPPQIGCAPATSTNPANAAACLLGLQAASSKSLGELAREHAERLRDEAIDLAAWCRATASQRADLTHRAAFVASDRAQLIAALLAYADGDVAAATSVAQAAAVPPRVAFLFPGQGSQMPGMGKELAADEPVFLDALDAAAARLTEAGIPAPLHTLMWQDDGSLLQRTDATQPALCAYQLAMFALLRSVGIVPDAVLGHSVGDYAAATAAGVLDGSQALQLCAARGRLMVERCPSGGLLAVLAPLDRFEHLLGKHPDVSIAVHNAPANHAVGGDPQALDALQRELEAEGMRVRRLPVSHAFHTANTDAMLAPFQQQFDGVRLRLPVCTLVNCATGEPAGAEVTTSEYWVRHVREPVQFSRGLHALAAQACDFWLELGPTAMLSALARLNGIKNAQVIPLQRGQQPARATFLAALARLWVHGVPMDLAAANLGEHAANGQTPHSALPTYPFDRQRFWLTRKPALRTQTTSEHPLLGSRQQSSLLQEGQLLFCHHLSKDSPAWLADHVAFQEVLFPAAAMLECALKSEHLRSGQMPVRVAAAVLRAPLKLDQEPIQVEALSSESVAGNKFCLKSLEAGNDNWRTHLDAVTETPSGPSLQTPTDALKVLSQRFRTDVPPSELYARCHNVQLDYGERFRCVRSLAVDDEHRGEALAEVVLPNELSAAAFVLHPALLDACFHTLLAVLPARAGTFLPIGVEQLTVLRAGSRRVWCHTRTRAATGKSRSADLDLYDEHGQLCAQVAGLQLVAADLATIRAATSRQRDLLYHVGWDNAPTGQATVMAKGLAIVGDPNLARAMQSRLPDNSAHVCTAEELPTVLAKHRIERVVMLATASLAANGDAMSVQSAMFGDALRVAQQTAVAPGPPQLCFVTHGMQPASLAPAGDAPHAASLLGLRRTIAIEHARLAVTSIDLDPVVPAHRVDEHATQLLRELQSDSSEPEIALRADLRRVPRLRRGAAQKNALLAPAGPFRLRAKAYGQFDHLQLEPLSRRAPDRGEIEVAMAAAALNFKDALHVLGMLREHSEKLGIRTAAEQPLGFEGSGVVVAVGEGVTNIAVGDRVVVSTPSCFQSHVTTIAAACMLLPPHVDLVAAAGLPTVFATVMHGLQDLAHIQKGEVVLVHAAAGGVGQAAIQLLRQTGCRVLATASPNKHGLVASLGAEVIGNSRTADFAAGVRATTGGEGVDVVLNTLSGDTVKESFAALKPGGRFVELGKLAVWSAKQVEQRRPDVSFFAFDLGDEFARDESLQPRLLAKLHKLLAAKVITPVQATIAPLADARDAFQQLAQGRHVGKVVVQMPTTEALQSDRTYLITGGSGGIATSIAASLVAAGARHIALLARSKLPAATVAELTELGATVHAVQADCADRGQLANALKQLRTTAPPLGGVVHAAGSLADGLISSLDWQQAGIALRPKIQGALLLDELTRDDALQFFVLLSSMAGSLGNAGQAAYAAANSFLDACANWRRQRGLPATAIAYGPWHGAGMAARMDEPLKTRLATLGIDFLPANTASALLCDHRNHARNTMAMSIRWRDWLKAFGEHLPPMLRDMRQADPETTRAAGPLDLRVLPADERAPRLRTVLLEQIAHVLGFADGGQVDPERTFQEQGMDSLMAVDAKDRLETILSATLPATLLFDHPDLARLVPHLVQCICPEAERTDELATMATDDIARLLAEELGQADRENDA